jgi:hypothetical protein
MMASAWWGGGGLVPLEGDDVLDVPRLREHIEWLHLCDAVSTSQHLGCVACLGTWIARYVDNSLCFEVKHLAHENLVTSLGTENGGDSREVAV